MAIDLRVMQLTSYLLQQFNVIAQCFPKFPDIQTGSVDAVLCDTVP